MHRVQLVVALQKQIQGKTKNANEPIRKRKCKDCEKKKGRETKRKRNKKEETEKMDVIKQKKKRPVKYLAQNSFQGGSKNFSGAVGRVTAKKNAHVRAPEEKSGPDLGHPGPGQAGPWTVRAGPDRAGQNRLWAHSGRRCREKALFGRNEVQGFEPESLVASLDRLLWRPLDHFRTASTSRRLNRRKKAHFDPFLAPKRPKNGQKRGSKGAKNGAKVI